MGVDYSWVNIDKHEYLNPLDFNLGGRLYQTLFVSNSLTGALYNLLSSDWKSDTFLFLGDGTTISENNNYQVLSMLRKKRILDQRFCHEMEYIEETYRCVSGLFYKAREEVMKEICYKLENGRFDTNLDVPFEMLFQRNSSFFRYTINHTKKEYFDTEHTVIDGFTYNPLPLLMSYSRNKEAGRWIGDEIEVSNKLYVSGYRNISYVQSLEEYE